MNKLSRVSKKRDGFIKQRLWLRKRGYIHVLPCQGDSLADTLINKPYITYFLKKVLPVGVASKLASAVRVFLLYRPEKVVTVRGIGARLQI